MDLESMSKDKFLSWFNNLRDSTQELALNVEAVREKLKELGINISELEDLNVSEIALAERPANLERYPLLTKDQYLRKEVSKSLARKDGETMTKDDIQKFNLTRYFNLIDRIRELSESQEIPELSELAEELEDLLSGVQVEESQDVEAEEDLEGEAEKTFEKKATTLAKDQGISKQEAYIKVAEENPELYERL